MWDYSLSRTSLSILYPDDMTTITTTNKNLIAVFDETYNRSWDDIQQDAFLESMAVRLEGAARGKKHETKKSTPTQPYQAGITQ